MSKFPVYESCLIEPPEICPHNKIVQTIGIKYRHELPVRLTQITHLKQLGQCRCCSNSAGWECPHLQNIHHNQRVAGGGEEIVRNESIFSCKITTPPQTTSSIYLKEGLSLLRSTKVGNGSSIINRFCQNYKKSKDYLTNHKLISSRKKDSVTWIMKPTKLNIKESSSTLNAFTASKDCSETLDKKKQQNRSNASNITYPCPIDPLSNDSSIQNLYQTFNENKSLTVHKDRGIDNFEWQRFNESLEKLFLKQKIKHNRFKHSKACLNSIVANYPLEQLSTDCHEEETTFSKPVKKLMKSKKSSFGNASGAVVEFYATDIRLEDMQYKDSVKETESACKVINILETRNDGNALDFLESTNNSTEFFDAINCTLPDKTTKDLVNSNKRNLLEHENHMPLDVNLNGFINTETQNNFLELKKSEKFGIVQNGLKKKSHLRRSVKLSGETKRKRKQNDLTSKNKSSQKTYDEICKIKSSVSIAVCPNTTKGIYNENFETDTPCLGRSEKYNSPLNTTVPDTCIEKKKKQLLATEQKPIFDSRIPARYRQAIPKTNQLHQNDHPQHKSLPISLPLNPLNERLIQNEIYKLNANKRSPSFVEPFKNHLFSRKPNSIPIYYHCPVRNDKMHTKDKFAKTTCTLSGNEWSLFEKNHF